MHNSQLHCSLTNSQAASKIPAKRRQTSIKPTVEKTTSLLYDRGALPDDLIRLVDLLTQHNHLDQASLSAITRNLYPLGKVSDEVLLRIVGALGHGHLKPSFPLQSLFLKWLVMVYHLLQNPTILSQTYAVLFNLLDSAAIRYVEKLGSDDVWDLVLLTMVTCPRTDRSCVTFWRLSPGGSMCDHLGFRPCE